MAKLNFGALSLMIAIFLITCAEYDCKVKRLFCGDNQLRSKKINLYYEEVCENYGPKPKKGRSTINKEINRK